MEGGRGPTTSCQWTPRRQRSAGMETVDSGEVAPGAPQPMHINVHIHQESALAKLLTSGCSLLRSHFPGATFQTWSRSRLLLASWVIQIVLGVSSGVLGGFLYIFYCSTLCSSGAAIWTGAVASLAGAVAFIHQKRGGICWPGPEETESPRSPSASLPHQALLRILLALAAFSTATAAIVIGASNFYRHRFYLRDFICDVSSKAWSWAPLSPSTPSPEEATRLHLCLSYLSMLEALFISFQVMLLGIWVLLLLASLVPLCLFCWSRSRHKKIDQKKLLEANGI
ncbi:transmembrane protein 176A isoform X1 [Canis lupus baileyi]|uniref:transmembrane protein 176A isoform X1 n=2 Tax=Canis lupus dingo TaxID=286419 RepID=UPI0015F1AA87|nr:transmembrane protein 176A isoform X1 [Canis lupus dingo]XP_038308564.1 transmembrane protein 176A isoform X1 [Canis lupus familiaris]XP_038415636.1 transmembrane protein 176A isoform X1 [Canis lupus familiaris]XP_038545397.1 transmembrane protein 176A isoform X1 [Canis lupus familiaris]